MKKSYLLLHLSVVLLGFSGIFGKLVTLNEGLITFYRVLFSSIILFFIVRVYKVNMKISLSEKLKIGRVGLLITVSWLLFYASIKYSNISIGVVCYCMASFFKAIFDPLVNRRKIKISELLLSGLTILGISLIFHFDSSYKIGIILGVISPAFASLYTICNQKLVRTYDSKLINYYQMISGTVVLGLLLPIYLHYFPEKSVIPSFKNTIYLFLLAGFCTVFIYITFTEILKKLSAFTVNLSLNLEPLYAIIIAFIFFNEGREVNLSFYIGLFFVMLSVVIQTVISLKRSK
ncbi:DMT family transporter [Chryseobacterium tructae]|uniref:DMT family transporter n=1 Tax=Chryseobacterium tructae TaxID=1037380 RepID=A0ABV7Y1T9_9FLAO|nr:DMT family transporter [Chryseobacterium tructae]MDN3694249.1 DMT family transporter [Chryseobacterium tructae]